jgi:hypothetical protein
MSGATSKLSGASGFNVGLLTAAGTYTQTDGTATFSGSVDVGAVSAAGSSFSVSGGTFTTSSSITVGAGAANNSSFSVSGGTVQATSITIGESGATASNVSGSITGDAIVKATTNSFNVGLGATSGASLLVADNASIDVPNTAAQTGNVFIGRETATNVTFTMTGGTIHTGRNFLLGNANGATGIIGNQSGGTITTTLDFKVSDTFASSTYNLSGTGAIVSNGTVVVGRQTKTATAVMNQTGGSVTAALGVSVGNAQSTDTSLWGSGTYNVSGGTITANQTSGTALAIAPQGNSGTFRVIGDEAIISVNGNMTVSGVGKLAYQLESDESLSEIHATGQATFSAGAVLEFDTSLASPTQPSYDLLIAAPIVDSGISFSGPPGWGYRIVNVPQAGDHNDDRTVDAADYATWRANDGANDQGYVDFRENFGVVGQQILQVYQLPPGASGLSQGLDHAAVPEPATVMLLLGAIAGLTLARRR